MNINAYHQPGVEAGKKAASAVLELQHKVLAVLGIEEKTADAVASSVSADPEAVYHVLEHLAANHPGLRVVRGAGPAADRFALGA